LEHLGLGAGEWGGEISMSEPRAGAAPAVAVILLADVGYRDGLSNKISLLGVFNKIIAETLPLTVQCALFLRLIDGRGEYPLILRVTEEDTAITVVETPLTVQFRDPLVPLDVILPCAFVARKLGAVVLSIMDKRNEIASLRLPVEAREKKA
jgi:hypothetical protein